MFEASVCLMTHPAIGGASNIEITLKHPDLQTKEPKPSTLEL